MSLSIHRGMQRIRVPGHPGETPGDPSTPSPALMSGVNPGPVLVHRAYNNKERAS